MFLHVLGAIAAFGYGFYAPIFGMASARSHSTAIGSRRPPSASRTSSSCPFAILMFITGAMLVQIGGTEWSDRWLSVAMLLYFIASASSSSCSGRRSTGSSP